MKTEYRQKNNLGLSLVEIIVAIAILGYILLAFTQVFMKSNMGIVQSKSRTLAYNWAVDKIEDVRTLYYDDISTGTWTSESEVLGEKKSFTRQVVVAEVSSDLKEVGVTVSWDELGETKNVRIVSFIAEYEQ